MSRSQTESIRDFILDCIASNPRSVARQVAQAYGISRQAANRHLDALVDAGSIEQTGNTRSKEYRLRFTSLLSREIRVTPVLNPERLWDDHIAPILSDDRAPVRDLCSGAFAELIRNVIEHARAGWINLSFNTTARDIDVTVADDGRGIFSRIAEHIGGAGARETAVLWSKHANARSVDFPGTKLALLGRNFEHFAVSSAGVTLAFDAVLDEWSVSDDATPSPGTRIAFRLPRSGRVRPATHDAAPKAGALTR
jgi:DNA-binding transcriptional ArsR family regulator